MCVLLIRLTDWSSLELLLLLYEIAVVWWRNVKKCCSIGHSNRHSPKTVIIYAFPDVVSSSGSAIQVQSSSSSVLLSLITADCHCKGLRNGLLIDVQGVSGRGSRHCSHCHLQLTSANTFSLIDCTDEGNVCPK